MDKFKVINEYVTIIRLFHFLYKLGIRHAANDIDMQSFVTRMGE